MKLASFLVIIELPPKPSNQVWADQLESDLLGNKASLRLLNGITITTTTTITVSSGSFSTKLMKIMIFMSLIFLLCILFV